MSRGIGYSEFLVTRFPGWDDMRSPATAVNPPGGASDPSRDQTTGLLDFASNQDNVVMILQQIPHAWKEGSELSPHLHWCKTTSASGTVAWKLEVKHWPIGGVLDGSWTDLGTYTTTATGTPDNNTANEHLITGFDEIDMEGYKISHCLLYRLTRDVSEDTYGASARVIEFDTHYQTESFGSNRLYQKSF
jgi:hypothetical protein